MRRTGPPTFQPRVCLHDRATMRVRKPMATAKRSPGEHENACISSSSVVASVPTLTLFCDLNPPPTRATPLQPPLIIIETNTLPNPVTPNPPTNSLRVPADCSVHHGPIRYLRRVGLRSSDPADWLFTQGWSMARDALRSQIAVRQSKISSPGSW